MEIIHFISHYIGDSSTNPQPTWVMGTDLSTFGKQNRKSYSYSCVREVLYFIAWLNFICKTLNSLGKACEE